MQAPGAYSTLTFLFSFFFRCLYNSDGDFLIGELMLWLFLSPMRVYLGCHLPASLFFQSLGPYSQDLEERVGFMLMPSRFGGLAPAGLLGGLSQTSVLVLSSDPASLAWCSGIVSQCSPDWY